MHAISQATVVWKALEEAVLRQPHGRAYVYFGKELSFLDVDRLSDRLATAFLKMGIGKGDRIGVIALNQPEWIYVYFAAAKIGAVVVGLSARYRKADLHRLIRFSQLKALVSIQSFADMDYAGWINENRNDFETIEHYLFIGNPGLSKSASMERMLERPADRAALEQAKKSVNTDDDLLILFTSGTTGAPKGAVITHKNQLSAAKALARHVALNESDILLLTLPLSHAGGITCGVLPMLLGRACCLLVPTFVVEEVFRQAAEHAPTIFTGFPTMHTMLMMHRNFASLDTRSVRLLITGGSSASVDMLRGLRQAFCNAAIMNMYGLTETSGAAVMSPWNSPLETMATCIGKPLDGIRVQIEDPEGRKLPPGKTGELCIKGDAVISGYFRMPSESQLVLDQQGWLHTGDMAYVDEEGRLVLKGRKTEMYIQEGFNVFPAEVEDFLASHPKVAMSAGIGVPDPVFGEVGRYYVVPQPGEEPPSVEELQRFCAEGLADFKRPSQIVFCDELPMTSTGKVNKIRLRENFEKNGK